MSGQYLYAVGDADTREWFERQWKIWPKRADERLTTNIRFHWSAVKAFRAEHGRDPDMSADFRSHVEYYDRHDVPPPSPMGGEDRPKGERHE